MLSVTGIIVKQLYIFTMLIIPSGQDALYQAQRMVTQAVYRPLQDQITKHQEYQEAQLLSHLISAGKEKCLLKIYSMFSALDHVYFEALLECRIIDRNYNFIKSKLFKFINHRYCKRGHGRNPPPLARVL